MPRQRTGTIVECLCAYSEKIFEVQNVSIKLEKGCRGFSPRYNRIKETPYIVMKSLKEKEKRGWFTSQHVTNMRSILKNKIRAMAKAQREEREEEEKSMR